MATGPTTGVELFKLARGLRDSAIESWARVAIAVTRSPAYMKMDAMLGQPALFVKAVARKPAEQALSQLLAQLQMPSRADVHAISQRLTRIEMVLDDLSASLETVRAVAAPQQRPIVREQAPAWATGTLAPRADPPILAKEQ